MAAIIANLLWNKTEVCIERSCMFSSECNLLNLNCYNSINKLVCWFFKLEKYLLVIKSKYKFNLIFGIQFINIIYLQRQNLGKEMKKKN